MCMMVAVEPVFAALNIKSSTSNGQCVSSGTRPNNNKRDFTLACSVAEPSPGQLRSYNLRVVKDTMIAVGARAVMDITSITHPEADDDMDDTTAERVDVALAAASRTSFCMDAYVKASINVITLASASVTRIRDARADAAKRAADTTTRVTRTANDTQLRACMRAEAKALGDTGAECIE